MPKWQPIGAPYKDSKRRSEIQQLRDENERLRAALKPFADAARQWQHRNGQDIMICLGYKSLETALNALNDERAG